jgi:uncharacterized protein YggU (UPF0235/DUF167 family)
MAVSVTPLIAIKVVVNAKQERVVPNMSQGIRAFDFKVYVREPAREGRANAAVCAVLAKHFGVRPAQVVVRQGLCSSHKRIEVLGRDG